MKKDLSLLKTDASLGYIDITKLSKEEYIFLWNERRNSYDVIHRETGELIQDGFKASDMVSAHVYNHNIGMIVAEAIRSGKTLAQIGQDPSMPSSSQILHWRSRFPEFRKMFEDAFRDRGHAFFDKVVDEANKVGDFLTKDEAAAKKIKIDTYKWAAAKSDPDRYGERKPELHVSSPSSIIINTGVDLQNAPSIDDLLKPIEAEYTVKETSRGEQNSDDIAGREADSGSVIEHT